MVSWLDVLEANEAGQCKDEAGRVFRVKRYHVCCLMPIIKCPLCEALCPLRMHIGIGIGVYCAMSFASTVAELVGDSFQKPSTVSQSTFMQDHQHRISRLLAGR